MEIGLTDDERDILVQLLDSEIRSVRSEIHHAESAEVKERFRDREESVKRLKARLEGRVLKEPIVT